MRNLPSGLRVPLNAVGIAKPLSLTTVATQQEPGNTREAIEVEVLAIGWESDSAAYLVFDRLRHEVFWVAEDSVEAGSLK